MLLEGFPIPISFIHVSGIFGVILTPSYSPGQISLPSLPCFSHHAPKYWTLLCLEIMLEILTTNTFFLLNVIPGCCCNYKRMEPQVMLKEEAHYSISVKSIFQPFRALILPLQCVSSHHGYTFWYHDLSPNARLPNQVRRLYKFANYKLHTMNSLNYKLWTHSTNEFVVQWVQR